MIEIIAALITGLATVIAAILAKPGDAEEYILFDKGRIVRDKYSDAKEARDLIRVGPTHRFLTRRYVWLFVVGAVAGGLLVHMVAQAAETGLIVGGYKVPPGTIVAYMGIIAPDGWLLCDGDKIDHEHKELRRILGESTPNLQGQFLRGLDPTGTNDPDGRIRRLGSKQADALKKHTHPILQFEGWTAGHQNSDNGLFNKIATNTGVNLDGADETRPKNVAVNFIIKY